MGFAGLRPAVPVSAPSHHAERRAGKGTPTSGQFSRWGPAQPAVGGRPGRTPSWPVVRLSAGPGVIGAGFALPRVPTGGRRSLAAGAIWAVGVPAGGCIFTATGQRSAVACRLREWLCAGFAGLSARGASLGTPRHYAERRAGKGTPTSGQFSRWGPAQPAGRRAAGKDPELAGGSPLGRELGVQRHPDGCVVRAGFAGDTPASGASLGPKPPCRATRRQGNADLWSAQPAGGGRQGRTPSWRVVRLSAGLGVIGAGFALPRVPPPPGELARGRRSLACGAHCRSGGPHREHWRRSFATSVLWRWHAAESRKIPMAANFVRCRRFRGKV